MILSIYFSGISLTLRFMRCDISCNHNSSIVISEQWTDFTVNLCINLYKTGGFAPATLETFLVSRRTSHEKYLVCDTTRSLVHYRTTSEILFNHITRRIPPFVLARRLYIKYIITRERICMHF